jgi:predicted nucleic acid-binding Zn ribbon protein
MEQIKTIIQDVIENISADKKDQHAAIFKTWQETVGKRASRHTKIVMLEKGRLIVNVDSSVWLFQLSLKRPALLKRLKGVISDIEKISFRIGRI